MSGLALTYGFLEQEMLEEILSHYLFEVGTLHCSSMFILFDTATV